MLLRPPEALLRWRLKAKNADAVGKRISLVDVLGFYSDAARPPEAPTLLEAKIR
jgi:hypothetical protein